MAASSIDTASIVGKYLSRQTTATRLNADANTADENTAVLESIAIAFLLNPQAVLSIVLNAKNSLQQLITADVQIIDYITAAISETQNPDALPSSTADLVDAQTALVELTKQGRVDTSLQAFTRYQNSIGNFLSGQLAPLVKRSNTGDFNRAGLEAKQDLFNSVGLFIQTHELFIQNLKTLAGCIDDYNGVDLSQIVSSQTISRVQTSLQQIQAGMTSGGMSNTVAALELMAGSAALQSISNTKKLYDDTIPLSAGLYIGPEPTAAFINSAVGPVLSTTAAHPHLTSLDVDGAGPLTFELPFTSFSGAPYVCNSLNQATYNIPVGVQLYIDITHFGGSVTHWVVPLTSGPTQTAAAVRADINSVFGIAGPIAADFVHTDNAIIIIGGTTDLEVQILASGPGSFSGTTFTPSPPSAHAILGFSPNQTSTAPSSFDLIFLQRFFQANYGVATQNITAAITLSDQLELTSPSDNPSVSSLAVPGSGVMHDFGFTTTLTPAVPLAMQIFDTAIFDDTGAHVQDPGTLGLLQGSVVHASAFINPVASLDGNRILFSQSIQLPLTRSAVRVVAPVVAATQASLTILGAFAGAFDGDLLPLQGLLSPLLTTPSLAQVNDALNAFKVIRSRLTNGATGVFDQLSAVVIQESQEPDDVVAQQCLQSLEERGLDNAQTLLTNCQFSNFFMLTSETASMSTNFMKNMETVVTTDLPTSTIEEEMPDGNTLAADNPNSILVPKEVP